MDQYTVNIQVTLKKHRLHSRNIGKTHESWREPLGNTRDIKKSINPFLGYLITTISIDTCSLYRVERTNDVKNT